TDPRKNTEGVLRAYHAYLQLSKRALKLVITGLKREYVEELLGKMGIAYCTPDIVYTGYVPGEDLPALYNGAFAFLYPSLQEGFGIPVLESMACGTPVITSNCSSLPEVAGEGGVLVNPSDFNEIAEALLRLENDTEYYQAQSAYGLARVKRFSWQQTTEDYRKIYNEITTRLSRTEQSRIKS
uniref:glycosyltransferase family 4 protein n=1 Tax=Prevotella heparinolytica TaxID=28113 RepID=UPI0035A05580